jgi:hypothetical protein
MTKRIYLIVLLSFSMAGCGVSIENIRIASAASIGEEIPEEVEIENVKRLPKELKWDANTKTFSYRCFADVKLKRTLCIKK